MYQEMSLRVCTSKMCVHIQHSRDEKKSRTHASSLMHVYVHAYTHTHFLFLFFFLLFHLTNTYMSMHVPMHMSFIMNRFTSTQCAYTMYHYTCPCMHMSI